MAKKSIGDSSDEEEVSASQQSVSDDEIVDNVDKRSDEDADLQEEEEEEEQEEEDEEGDNDQEDEIEEAEDGEDEEEDDAEEDDEEEDEEEDEDEEEEEEEDGSTPKTGVVSGLEGLDDEDDVDGEDDEDEGDEEEEDEQSSAGSGRIITARQRHKRSGTTANIGMIDLAELEGTRAKKVHLSAEEQRIKRAEMARRRRNLSQQRLEEEKKETLDKLLKKRAKKVRGSPDDEGFDSPIKIMKSRLVGPHPAFTNWKSSKDQFLVSVTQERAQFDLHKE